jgi:subtilase family serine protease
LFLGFAKVSGQNTGFSPDDIRAAYDVWPLLNSGYTGKGVTVAVVNTGIDATFYSDVDSFNRIYGLPNASITAVEPFGSAGTNVESPSGETTGDVEFVHSMAPGAKILLVLVGSNGNYGGDGFSYVISHNAADIATVSPSWAWWGQGAMSTVLSYNDEFGSTVDDKITLIAASNDWGSNNSVPWGTLTGGFWRDYLPDAYLMPQYSPYVTAVGGTVLTLQSGAYGSEQGWDRSGGGPSNLFVQPTWQVGPGVPLNGYRDIPDIALDASCDTPYAFYWEGGLGTFCGTSGGAPTFAGIVADIDQAAGGRVGFLNPTLYSLGSSDPSVYHEITSGCSLVEEGTSTTNGYCAHAGWNFVTGWGSIDAAKLAIHLAPTAHIVVPEFSVGTPMIFMVALAMVVLLSKRRSLSNRRYAVG